MKHERLLSLLLIAQAEIDKTRYTLIAYSASRKKKHLHNIKLSSFPFADLPYHVPYYFFIDFQQYIHINDDLVSM